MSTIIIYTGLCTAKRLCFAHVLNCVLLNVDETSRLFHLGYKIECLRCFGRHKTMPPAPSQPQPTHPCCSSLATLTVEGRGQHFCHAFMTAWSERERERGSENSAVYSVWRKAERIHWMCSISYWVWLQNFRLKTFRSPKHSRTPPACVFLMATPQRKKWESTMIFFVVAHKGYTV